MIHEQVILNDSAVGLGTSMGEVIDTDAESDADSIGENEKNHTSSQQIKKRSKPKVHRPCLYCGIMQSALTRHLINKHSEEAAVIKAKSLQKREKISAFDDLRKQGILKHNQNELKKPNPVYIRERHNESNSNDQLVICSKCKGWYSKTYKARHQVHCGRNTGQVMMPVIPVKSLSLVEFGDDFKCLLNDMIIDRVSTVAKTDRLILVIGSRTFNSHKCKKEKISGVKRRVRALMRLLSRMYIKFQESIDISHVSSDMFKVENMKHLRSAIDELTQENGDEEKSGLKVQIQNAIKDSIKILHAHYIVEGDKSEAAALDDFCKVFTIVQHELFNSALYNIRQKRNKATRKPGNLPEENVIEELNSYLKGVTATDYIVYKLPSTIFIEVRDAACARLTIYNGRRGGEPARLYIYQWKEAVDGIWIRPAARDLYKEELESGNRITFQEGKGNKLVPIFIPPDLVAAISFLCSDEARNALDVPDSNKYVFPSIKGSENHISGWHSLMNCCKRANLEGKVNGTMNRHRVSTIIGSFGLPETEQQLVFDHFGHSGDVNKNIYQIPQAERQLATTGKYLIKIDKGLDKGSEMPTESNSLPSCSQVAQPCLSSTPKAERQREF